MSRPDVTALRMSPHIGGSSSSLELVADRPTTIWRKIGRNTMPPYWAKPSRNTIKLHSATTLLPKRRNGMIGSVARVSHTRNVARSPAPATPRVMIVLEPQGYWSPPQTSARSRQVTLPTRRAAPS